MKVLDAGTKSLSDHEVLTHILDTELANAQTDATAKADNRPVFGRPDNYLVALKRHKEYLAHKERPFATHAHYEADGTHMLRLMETLEPRAQLTKTELLMVLNHAPDRRELLIPLIEDIDARFGEEDQDWIVTVVGEVLGKPDKRAGEQGEETAG